MRNSPSVYYNNYDWAPRQAMIEDLIIHAIRMNGVMLKYIPRETFVRDKMFGDDNFTRFEYAVDMEAWPKTVDTFEGQGDIISKFGGFEIKDQVTFSISRKRWSQIRTEKFSLEQEGLLLAEDSPTTTPGVYNSIILEDANNDGYSIVSDKPSPGDLIYFPMVDKIFEITRVEHESLFYQHGKLMTYDLYCELFDYSNEEFTTGITEIDDIADFNTDQLTSLFLLEDGGELLLEDGSRFVVDGVNELWDVDASVENNDFQIDAEDVVDWSERSPFSKIDRW